MKTISFDFDWTLWNEGTGEFIPECVQVLNQFLDAGDHVIIVTSRIPQWIPEVHSELLRLNWELEIFSAPACVGDESDSEKTKSTVLIEQGAVLHFDDLDESDELIRAREHGIEIRRAPYDVRFP